LIHIVLEIACKCISRFIILHCKPIYEYFIS